MTINNKEIIVKKLLTTILTVSLMTPALAFADGHLDSEKSVKEAYNNIGMQEMTAITRRLQLWKVTQVCMAQILMEVFISR